MAHDSRDSHDFPDDERMKALFTTVGEQPGPPLGFTADGIARRGRRIRLARWSAGVGASLVVAAALTATIALTANRPAEPGTPLPGPEITTTEVPTTPDLPTTTTTTITTTTTALPTTTDDSTESPTT